MITTIPVNKIIADWIATLGWDMTQETGWPVVSGPEMPDAPDKIIVLTGSGGPGYLTEEAGIDGQTFQARLRGPANDADAAQAAIKQLDELVLGAVFPVVVDGVTISHVHREGSPPVPLPLDPNDRRFEYTVNYIILLGS